MWTGANFSPAEKLNNLRSGQSDSTAIILCKITTFFRIEQIKFFPTFLHFVDKAHNKQNFNELSNE